MVTTMALVAALCAQNSPAHHVRGADPRFNALLEAGMAQSATFRQVVEALDRSDVIVYVEPKVTHAALGAFLRHHVVVAGGFRYLHVDMNLTGSRRWLIPLLAHELQHAVEVSQDPAVHDEQGVDQLFIRLHVGFGCGESSCAETAAAKSAEATVREELKRSH